MAYRDPEKKKEYDRRYYAANTEKRKEYDRRWREANPEKRRENTKRNYRRSKLTPAGRAVELFRAASRRASTSKRGPLPFTITRAWVEERVARGVCEVTGLPFEFGPPPPGMKRHPWSPSLDQKVAGAGYTPENTQVVVTALNYARNEFGDETFATLAAAYLSRNAH